MFKFFDGHEIVLIDSGVTVAANFEVDCFITTGYTIYYPDGMELLVVLFELIEVASRFKSILRYV